MKDIATHQYHGIMLELVWETATVRVPDLLRAIDDLPEAGCGPGPAAMFVGLFAVPIGDTSAAHDAHDRPGA
jgi:hypothetical protein